MNEQVIRVTLDRGPFGEMVRAVKPILAGEVVFYLSGEIVATPTKFTIQLDETRHVLTTNALWKSMNHACEPNVRIDVGTREMIAVRDIRPGEELTFNYNTTEWDMASPFPCGCGAPNCAGTIRGFRHLSAEQRERLRPYLSPFIASRIERFD
jgi:hypothetical protein